MSEELEPLPEGDDPYALLAVEPTADERDLKRAYARRIKVYRPDRAPAEFARVQAAFERAKAMIQIRAMVAAQHGEGAAVTMRPADRPGAIAVEVTLPEVVADAAAVAERPAPVAEAPAPVPPVALRSGETVTWRELSTWTDVQAAFERWLSEFAARMMDHTTEREAIAMANEPAFVEDAAHEPAAAILALKAVSALAWRDWGAASRLFRKLKRLVSHPAVDRMVDRATLDLDAAGKSAHNTRPFRSPPLMREWLQNGPLLMPAARNALASKLRVSLQEEPELYLELLGGSLAGRHQLSEALAHRLLDGVPGHRRELSALPEKLGAALGREMRAASRWTWWILPLAAFVLGLIGGLLAWKALEGVNLEADKDHDAQAYAFMAACSVGVGFGGAIDWLLYRTLVRRRLALTVARVGVTRAAARQWLQQSIWRWRLRRFGVWMERDHVLRLIGMLAATVADDGEMDGGG